MRIVETVGRSLRNCAFAKNCCGFYPNVRILDKLLWVLAELRIIKTVVDSIRISALSKLFWFLAEFAQ